MNTISSKFGRYRSRDNSPSKAEEKRSCWAIVTIDGFELNAKIIHRGWGEFEILEDNCEGKYIGEIVDASDVVRCRVQGDNTLKPMLTLRDCR